MKRFLLFVLLLTSLAKADYYGSHAIDDYLTVQETLHDSSGDAVAATGAVDIWVYEDDNDTQIIDLTMDAFDSVTGLYEQKFQLTSGAGFEAGKTYTILIQATADGASGIITHIFQINAASSVEQWAGTNVASPATAGYPAVTIKDGTGTGEIDTSSGTVLLRSATETQIDNIETDTAAADTTTELRTLMTGADTPVAKESTLTSMDSKLDTIDTNVDDIETDTSAYDTDGEYATAIWNAATASYGGGGTYGQAIEDVLADSGELQTNQGNWATATSVNLENDAITAAKITDAAWQELIELLFTFDATATYGTQAGSVVDQIADNAASGGATAQQFWEYDISALSNTDQGGGALIWMFNVTEGDSYIDITQTPWQAVMNKKGTPGTEYLRKDLFDVDGGNVTSTATVIGKQTEP